MSIDEQAIEIGKLVLAKIDTSKQLILRREELQKATRLFDDIAAALRKPDSETLRDLLREFAAFPIDQLQAATAKFEELLSRLADLNDKLREIGV